MILYRFCKQLGRQTALTPDVGGSNLPHDPNPWVPAGQVEINRGETVPRIGASADQILDAIEKYGIFMWS